MLTIEERILNIEAGIVEADNKISDTNSWNELDIVLEEIRERISSLYARLTAVKNTINTSEKICKTASENL